MPYPAISIHYAIEWLCAQRSTDRASVAMDLLVGAGGTDQ
jgi:hypothetical protein